MLNNIQVTEYCATFAGYGHWEAPVWLIGIEEAGGATELEVAARLTAWQQRGKRCLESIPEFCQALGVDTWHGESARLQTTWTQLIRLLLVANGKPDSLEAILAYQRCHLGTLGGKTCLLELFPLPSPRTRDWNYGKWSRLAWLESREAYEKKIVAPRIELLRQKIAVHKPPVVIFYGSSQLKYWRQIMGNAEYSRPIHDKLIARERDGTAFYVIRHPAYRFFGSRRNDYFREIGRFLKTKHGHRWIQP